MCVNRDVGCRVWFSTCVDCGLYPQYIRDTLIQQLNVTAPDSNTTSVGAEDGSDSANDTLYIVMQVRDVILGQYPLAFG